MAEKALEIRKKLFGEKNATTAVSLHNLASCVKI
jgi:hypothetical protein